MQVLHLFYLRNPKQFKVTWINNGIKAEGLSVQGFSVQFSQSCLTLCVTVDCSTPGRPVYHQLLDFAQTRVHWAGDATQPPHPLSSPSLTCFQSFSASGSFPISQFFTLVGQSIGLSASVLPMNIQDWFPLGFTDWISFQSQGKLKSLLQHQVQKHQFFGTQFLYSPTLTSIGDYTSGKYHRFD